MLGHLPLSQLRLSSTASWHISIDILVSRESNGSLIDMISAGIFTALSTLRLPECTVLMDEGKRRIFLKDNALFALDTKGLPLALSFGLLDGGIVCVDPDAAEEACLAVITLFGPGMCGMRKAGKGTIDAEYLTSLGNLGEKLLSDFRAKLISKIEDLQ